VRVPPVAAVRAATRVRNGLDRAYRSAALPFQLVLERVLGLVDTKTLGSVVELRIPELLADGPRTVDDLAATSGADPDALRRVLRYLVSRGLFRARADDRFENNSATDILREGHPWSWRAWVEFAASDWHAEIWDHLIDRLRGHRPATEAAFGVPFFEYLNRTNPDAGRTFNQAMACGSRIQGLLFAERVPLTGFQHVCDVGGGTGSILVHLLRTNPRLRGTVFDLPELAADARAVIDAELLGDRAQFVGGDFFESVPPACDLYLLFAVVHDWGDQECHRILTNVADAMTPGGRIMVIERPLPTDDRPDFAKLADMLMLLLGDGGRERTDADYERVFANANLKIRRRITLPSLFVVYDLARQ
jgi:hypothetical protein